MQASVTIPNQVGDPPTGSYRNWERELSSNFPLPPHLPDPAELFSPPDTSYKSPQKLEHMRPVGTSGLKVVPASLRRPFSATAPPTGPPPSHLVSSDLHTSTCTGRGRRSVRLSGYLGDRSSGASRPLPALARPPPRGEEVGRRLGSPQPGNFRSPPPCQIRMTVSSRCIGSGRGRRGTDRDCRVLQVSRPACPLRRM